VHLAALLSAGREVITVMNKIAETKGNLKEYTNLAKR